MKANTGPVTVSSSGPLHSPHSYLHLRHPC